MRYELVALEDEVFGDEGEFLAEGTWRQMEAMRDEALDEAAEDYDDGRYPFRQLRRGEALGLLPTFDTFQFQIKKQPRG